MITTLEFISILSDGLFTGAVFRLAVFHSSIIVSAMAFSTFALQSASSQPTLSNQANHKHVDFEQVIAQTTSPEFERLLARHQAIAQNGYASVLLDELNQDSLSALIDFLRCRLHKIFSLSHTQLVKVIPRPTQEITVPIILDYPNGYIVIEWNQDKIYRRIKDDFPEYPWEKK